jgi:hypothetical protein
MSSSFSEVKRAQVFALDLMQSILGQYFMMAGGRVPKKSKDCINRLYARRLTIMDMTVHVQAVGDMSDKRVNQYMRIVRRSKLVLDKHFRGAHVDGSAMLNALLALIEDVYASIPAAHKRTKREWDLLRGSLATLYRHHDPEMTSPWQAKGLEVCKDLHKAIKDELPFEYGRKPQPTKRSPRLVRVVA